MSTKLPMAVRGTAKHTVTMGLTSVLLVAGAAQAELRVSAYSGVAETLDADVEFEQKGGTVLTFEDVMWDDESLKTPIYYGLRLTYWFHRASSWGLGFDFTHAKMIADPDQVVAVRGIRSGAIVAGRERLGETFSNLQLSHGHNLLTLNGLYRFPLIGHLEPYAGLGAGAAIPHVETNVGGVETSEYQLAGPAVQGLIGVTADVTQRLSVFAEYKLSYADINADLRGGGTVQLAPWTNHFVLGLSLGLF